MEAMLIAAPSFSQQIVVIGVEDMSCSNTCSFFFLFVFFTATVQNVLEVMAALSNVL